MAASGNGGPKPRVWANLRVGLGLLLGRIFVSHVAYRMRLCVGSTLKPKETKKPITISSEDLGFYQLCALVTVYWCFLILPGRVGMNFHYRHANLLQTV